MSRDCLRFDTAIHEDLSGLRTAFGHAQASCGEDLELQTCSRRRDRLCKGRPIRATADHMLQRGRRKMRPTRPAGGGGGVRMAFVHAKESKQTWGSVDDEMGIPAVVGI